MAINLQNLNEAKDPIILRLCQFTLKIWLNKLKIPKI